MFRVAAVSKRSLLSHVDLSTTRRQAEVKPRLALKLNGASPPPALGLYAGDIDTLECALLERMYYCKVGDEFVSPPSIPDGVLDQRLGPLRAQLLRRMPDYAACTLDEFVELCHGPKKEFYRQAVASLGAAPVERQDATSKCFVKREKCNVSKAPRVIQPRSPRYNASIGRFLKPLEHPLYEGLRRVAGVPRRIVAKGLNLDQIGKLIFKKWERFDDPVAVGMDATKFDMHVGPEMLGFEHSIYQALYPRDRQELDRLLRWQMHNRGVGYAPDGKLKYSVTGKRFSGDMNTAMGNCLIMCFMVIAYCRERGIEFDLVNNGDDCVVFMERGDEPTFRRGLEQWFLDLGFRMVAEPTVDIIEQVEFCQMHPVLVGGRYRMVRNPATAIEKDSFCVRTLNNDDSFREWATGVARGGYATCDGVPVLKAFYSYLDGRVNVRNHLLDNTGMRRMARGMKDENREVDDEARWSFYLAFGIDPQTQTALEDWYHNHNWVDTVGEGFVSALPDAKFMLRPEQFTPRNVATSQH